MEAEEGGKEGNGWNGRLQIRKCEEAGEERGNWNGLMAQSGTCRGTQVRREVPMRHLCVLMRISSSVQDAQQCRCVEGATAPVKVCAYATDTVGFSISAEEEVEEEEVLLFPPVPEPKIIFLITLLDS